MSWTLRGAWSPAGALIASTALWVFAAHAYFYNGAQDNHNARLDAIFAFVEPGHPESGSFRIDRFIVDPARGINTGDWARFDGHYYSNKAPGTILLGVPVYFALHRLEPLFGVDPETPTALLLNAYAIHLAVTVFWVSLSAPFFLLLAHRQLGSWRRAWAAGTLLYFATLLFPFGSQLWGHPTAAAFVVIGLFGVSRATRPWLFVAGLSLGMAVLCDYLAAVIVFAVLLSTALPPGATRLRSLMWIGLGGALPALAMLGYHWLCFGTPFTTASAHSSPEFLVEGDVGGLFGLPSLGALYGITLSSYRGLFFYCPVLLPALLSLARRGTWAGGGVVRIAALSAVSMLLANACFNGWHAGSSMGPRYQILALPAFALLVGVACSDIRVRRATLALFAVSCLNMLVVVAIAPAAPQALQSPLSLYYGAFFEMIAGGADAMHAWSLPVGSIPIDAPELARWASFNLGEWMGLGSLASVAPWLLGVALAGLATFRMAAVLDRADGGAPELVRAE